MNREYKSSRLHPAVFICKLPEPLRLFYFKLFKADGNRILQYYFEPGQGYLGGNFFFRDEQPPYVIFTDNAEADELLMDDEFPENGLRTALMVHLITSAHILLEGGKVSNFLIHPSVRTDQHSKFAEKIGDYLNDIFISYEEAETSDAFKFVYDNLKETKRDIQPFNRIFSFICKQLENDLVKVLVINSLSSYNDNVQYESGINIIVGGNSLGRGVTFPQLQTIYYCRVAKNPQADTMWQHARMFGYDRDPALMRVFMPPILYKLFSDINTTNNSITAQIKKQSSNIKIYYPTGLRPTRKNVLDKKAVGVFSGGINYFPFYPINKDIGLLDQLLAPFTGESYSVSLKLIVRVLAEEHLLQKFPGLTHRDYVAIAAVGAATQDRDVRAMIFARDTAGEIPKQTIGIEQQKAFKMNIKTIE